MAQTLAQFVESVSGTSHLRVEQDLGDGFVRLQTSEAERRQAIQDIRSSEDIVLELLRNSRDAHAREIYVAVSREANSRTIVVIDDGEGIPASKHTAIFEPRVTSKLDTSHEDKWGYHGRGMALYSISVNAEVACVKSSAPHFGCALFVETDLSRLHEKRDQSTFPSFIVDAEGTVVVRGPKNIVRTAVEFALDARSECTVFIGSPIEIAATLYARASKTLSALDRAFTSDPGKLALVKRLGISSDPAQFCAIAADMGLPMSERSARRIMDGEIAALPAILDRIILISDNGNRNSAPCSTAPRTAKRPKQRDLPVLSADDRAEFETAVAECYRNLAQKYYLEPDVKTQLRVSRGSLSVTIPLIRQE